MRRILFLSILLISLKASAQQDILLSQYMFNHLAINPAYAGSKEYMQATLLYRNQWVNWSDAPTTEVASVHTPIGMTNLGWGALISHDHEGVTDRTDLYANFAYHLKVSEKLKLGMGLRGGVGYWVRDNQKIRDVFAHHPSEWDPNDPRFAGDNTSNFLPNVGAGLFLYSQKFYAGLSAPEMLSYDPEKSLSVNTSTAKLIPHQVRHYFATTGVVFEVSPDVAIKPSVLVKYTENAPVEADLNLNVLLAQVLWIGGSYRTDDAFVALIELQVTKKLRLGYSYDFTTTDINRFSDGSHEIMLGYDFGYDVMKIKTPRYF